MFQIQDIHSIFLTTTFLVALLPVAIVAKPSLGVNLALGKPASQRSTFPPFEANRTVDGNINGGMDQHSCSHTLDTVDKIHWWQVDLQNYYNVKAVRVKPRDNCCLHRFRNVTIEISMEDPKTRSGFPARTPSKVCTQIPSVADNSPRLYYCDSIIGGRFVRFVKTSDGTLEMCEVEVYGTKIVFSWGFEFMTGKGLEQRSNSLATSRHVTECVRQRVAEMKKGVTSYPLIQIDIPSGVCRFLTNVSESQNSQSSNCVVYNLLN